METELKSYPALPPSGGRELRLLAEAASEFWDIPLEELKQEAQDIHVIKWLSGGRRKNMAL